MTRHGFLIFALAALFAPSVQAQDQETVCRLWQQQKSGNQGAAYRPGVDVNGNPIVPADLDAAPAPFSGTTIAIPVTIDLAQKVSQTQTLPQGMELKAGVGVMEIRPDGAVFYDGRDMTGSMAVLCEPGTSLQAPAQQAQSPVFPPPASAPAQSISPATPAKTETHESKEEIIWGEGH